MPALATVKLSDLASIVGPRKQPVMRDRYFQPVRRCRSTSGWRRKTARSPTDAPARPGQPAHCDYFGLSQDLQV
jgi:hypothetical protein